MTEQVTPVVGSAYEITPVLDLFKQSTTHQDYGEDEIRDFVLPALVLRQCFLYYRADRLVGFASLAFFSKEVSEKYATRTYRPKPQEWASGDEAWIVDIVAPHGDMKAISAHIDGYLDSMGFKEAHFWREKSGRNVTIKVRSARSAAHR